MATFRSLFLEGCVPCRDGFTLTSRPVLQSLGEPLLPPRAGHPVNLYSTGCNPVSKPNTGASCLPPLHRPNLLSLAKDYEGHQSTLQNNPAFMWCLRWRRS